MDISAEEKPYLEQCNAWPRRNNLQGIKRRNN